MTRDRWDIRKGLMVFGLAASVCLPLLAPLPVSALSLIPCGRNEDSNPTDQINETAPCTTCHIIVGIKRLIDWMRNVMLAIAVAVLVGMGILYIVSTGNDSLMGTAKGGMTAALIGFAVILSAWLIVNFIFTLPIFGNTNLVTPNWYTVSCDLASSARTSTGLALNTGVSNTNSSSTYTDPTADPNRLPSSPPSIGSTDPSTGVSLTLQNGSLIPGQSTTLTMNGSVNFNVGPVSFTGFPSTISIPNATSPSTTVAVLSGTPIGTYTITAMQNGTRLAEVVLTVVSSPPITVTDPNAPGDGSAGGGGNTGNQYLVSFTTQNFSVMENAGNASLTLTRPNGAALGAGSVTLSLADGPIQSIGGYPAREGMQYTTPSNLTVNFAAGATTGTLLVPIIDNAVAGVPGTSHPSTQTPAFKAVIASASGDARIGSPSQAQITIFDDESDRSLALPKVVITDPSDGETVSSQQTISFTVTSESGDFTLIRYGVLNLDGSTPPVPPNPSYWNIVFCNNANNYNKCSGPNSFGITTSYAATDLRFLWDNVIEPPAGTYQMYVRACVSTGACATESVVIEYP